MKRAVLYVSIVIMFLNFGTGFQRALAEGESVEAVFYVASDAYIDQGHTIQNYGLDSSLKVRSWKSNNARTLIFFDISKIPIGATVLRARLFLYVSNPPASNRTYLCHHLISPWVEDSANWNNRPQSTPTYASSAKVSASGWVSWDVTNQLQKFLNGIKGYAWTNFGWEILDAAESSPEPFETAFCSKEFEEQDKRPFLTMEFIPPKLEIVMGSSTFISGSWIGLTIKRVSQDGVIALRDSMVKMEWVEIGSITIKLSTSSKTGKFSLSEGGVAIDRVTIQDGDMRVVLYYFDSSVGTHVLSAEVENYPHGYYLGGLKQVSVIMDDHPPQITGILRDPESPAMGDVVRVYANVSDVGSGVREVNLYYSTSGGDWVKIPMSLQVGRYMAYIPGQGIFTELSYYIEAIDNAGNIVKTAIEKLTVGIPIWIYIAIVALAFSLMVIILIFLRKPKREK